jgi:outer membrane receptor for ferrienterochelin and colicin
MKLRILTIILALCPFISMAKDIKGKIVEKPKSGEIVPLPGASVFWKNTSIGTAANALGVFNLQTTTKSNTLVVQFVGYKTKEITVQNLNEEIVVELVPSVELGEVTVSSRKLGTVIDRDNPIQTQSITGAELCKAACCSLAESFETNASVDVSYADAATGAKSIKLLGLTGKYIEMMTEKNPNFKGLASVYGMEYVPGPWMESIQVSKGVGSVVNGYESITGQINIQYLKPQRSPIFYLNAYANDQGMSEANVITSAKLSPKLSTSILAHGKDNDKELDHNDDNFLDHPMVTQYNFINRWNWDLSKHTKVQFGVKYIDEERIGGQKGYDKSKPNDKNNAYRVDIDTRRFEAFAKVGYVFPNDDEKSIALITNFASHKQNSFYGLKDYDAEQKYLYANLLYQSYIGSTNHKYVAGLSFVYDDFYDRLTGGLGTDRTEKVAGAYMEYTWLPLDEITLQLGMRYDDHNIYGGFWTPRLHFRYQFAEKSTMRIAAGHGRRTANPIAENSYLLASNRKMEILGDLKQEKAWNFGVSLTQEFRLFGKDFTASGDFYRTSFENQVIVDLDNSARKVLFYNLDGDSWANNYQLEIKFEPVKRLDVTTAFRFSDVKADINNEFQRVPYVNRYKGLLTLSYATNFNKWQFDFTTQFNGDMRIPSTKENPTEFQRREKSPAYAMFSGQITKRFRIWEIYAGAENIGAYTQKDPIISANDPMSDYFDASMIWGPISKRKFYVGVRFTIDRDE